MTYNIRIEGRRDPFVKQLYPVDGREKIVHFQHFEITFSGSQTQIRIFLEEL